MPRTVSTNMRRAMYEQETDEVQVMLLRITHPDLAETLYLSSDPTVRLTTDPIVYGTVSRGVNYLFIPMSVILPDDKQDAAPSAKIQISNITRELVPIIRSTSTPAQMRIEICLASAPSSIDITYPEFDIVAAEYDADNVSLTLQLNALQSEPFPADSITPSNFPGLF